MDAAIVKGNAFIARRLKKGEYRSVFYWNFKENTLKELRIGFVWLKQGMHWRKIFVRVITKNGGEAVFHIRVARGSIRITGVQTGKLFFDGFF